MSSANDTSSDSNQGSNLGDLTKQLIEVLSKKPVNVLFIRSLCRNHPGLIASAGLRLKTWATLLLGPDYQTQTKKKFLPPTIECEEQHVLEADVHRTRAENEYFRSSKTRAFIKNILQKFCVDHYIQYKQGMNEVLAPFLSLHSNTNNNEIEGDDSSSFLFYLLFKAFLFRYLERFFCVDDSSFLYKSFRLFHLLLVYHDPQLGYHLNDLDFTPEFYAPQWFLTLYARALPLQHVLRLWDMMISVDDPAFMFFIGLTLLIKRRDSILLSDISNIPEIINSHNISFQNEEEIDQTVRDAWFLYRTTPRCLLRQLRLCCVSTVELTPIPIANAPLMKVNVDEYDQLLSIQSVRNCFALTSQELIESMLTPSHLYNNTNDSHSNSSSNSINNSGIDSIHMTQQYVIIDIRSYEESVLSGGGIMPRAIQLEPEFLNRPEAFEVWLQHFDGTRGCNICIVDLPPPQWTGLNLWRRLLLGEGDGQKYANLMNRYEVNNFKENQKRLEALIQHSKLQHSSASSSSKNNTNPAATGDNKKDATHSSSSLGGAVQPVRDDQSRYYKEEENAILADVNSPAMMLAMVLQRNGFPRISILEGGFPALIDTLVAMKGKVEPIVVDHDSNKWIEFLRNTGRYQDKTATSTSSNSYSAASFRLTKMISLRSSSDDNDENNGGNNNKGFKHKKEKDLTDLERYELALQVAERLQHNEMKRILQQRIEELKDFHKIVEN
eukprot:gene694-742_t